MLTKDRQDRIINIVNTQRSVTVAELTELLEASEATIRRDLTVLDSQGLIVKVFGGATAVEKDMSAKEDDVPAKSQKNVKSWPRSGSFQNSRNRPRREAPGEVSFGRALLLSLKSQNSQFRRANQPFEPL